MEAVGEAGEDEIRAYGCVQQRDDLIMRRICVEDFQAGQAGREDVVVHYDDRLFDDFIRFLLSDNTINDANDCLCISMFSVADFLMLLRLFFFLIVRIFRFQFLRCSYEVCREEVEGNDRRRVMLICSYIRDVLYFRQIESGHFKCRYLVLFDRATLGRDFLGRQPVFVRVIMLFDVLYQRLQFIRFNVFCRRLIRRVLIRISNLQVLREDLSRREVGTDFRSVLGFDDEGDRSRYFDFFFGRFVIGMKAPCFVTCLANLFIVRNNRSARRFRRFNVFFCRILVLLDKGDISIRLAGIVYLIQLRRLPYIAHGRDGRHRTSGGRR